MNISSIIFLWSVCAVGYMLHLASLPRDQRYSHPGSIVGASFLLAMLDGIISEYQIGEGNVRNPMLYESFLLPAMQLHAAAFVLFVLSTRCHPVDAHGAAPLRPSGPIVPPRDHHVIMKWVVISTVALNFFFWFYFCNLGAVLFSFEGGRGAVLKAFSGEETGITRYGSIFVTLWTFVAYTWAVVRPISEGRFSWMPVWIALIPLTVGIATTARSGVFQAIVPAGIMYVLIRPRAPAYRVALLCAGVLFAIILVTALRESERSGLLGFWDFLSAFDVGERVSVHSGEAVAGGCILQTSGAMFVATERGYVGAGHLLQQLNILPTFVTGRIGNELWFQEYLGISTESVGITVPVVPDLYLDVGWWGVLFFIPLGMVLGAVYRKALQSREQHADRNALFPAWIVFYVLCLCGCLLMWHQSVRGLYRTFFNSAAVCYGLHWFFTRYMVHRRIRRHESGGVRTSHPRPSLP